MNVPKIPMESVAYGLTKTSRPVSISHGKWGDVTRPLWLELLRPEDLSSLREGIFNKFVPALDNFRSYACKHNG